MNAVVRAGCCALCCTIICLAGRPGTRQVRAEAPPPRAQLDRGRELFEREWIPGDPRSSAGDGLGPLRNDSSCAACHHLGGTGGAGPNEKNVQLLSAAPARKNFSGQRRSVDDRLDDVHPALSARQPNVILHHFSSDLDYDDWKAKRLGMLVPDNLSPARQAIMPRALARDSKLRKPVVRLGEVDGIALALSRRNTPALFGAGLIDAVPAEVLASLAEDQPKRHPGVTGRVAPADDQDVGRFGWRGQIATLREFVLAACANELGLEVPDHRQPIDPQAPFYQPPGLDLDQGQCDDLVAFVARLPRPDRIVPDDPQAAVLVNNGERLFATVGCAACHVPDVGPAEGIYSDLLLHDMGGDLEDPVAARPEVRFVGSRALGGGYWGGSIDIFEEVPSEITREWRTPPLWGVRDSAPYLHDGRAATLEEAISLHGGEAAASRKRFLGLPAPERSRIIAFLSTLTAPGGAQ